MRRVPELVRFFPPDFRTTPPVVELLDLPRAEAACVGRLPMEIDAPLPLPDPLLWPFPTERAEGSCPEAE